MNETEIRRAADSSVPLLQTASQRWFEKQTCVSCHHQSLPMMVFDLARHRGVNVDRARLEQMITKGFGFLRDLDQAVQASRVNQDPVSNKAYVLVNAAPLGLPHSPSTGAYARLIARRQLADGHWTTADARPPSSFSLFAATAIAMRTVQQFLPDSMEQERRGRVEHARSWLTQNTPFDTEDRAYQLFGLHWADARPESLTRERDKLIAEQRPDGGWAQMSGLPSDAYATGEALAALNQAGGVPASDPAYQKGLLFLLSTQKPDGTWFVKSRIHAPEPVSPPYFESGLPYGHDQFISAAGTSWATAALLLAIPETPDPPDSLALQSLRPADVPSWAETVLFGGTSDVQRLLESGWNPNSATRDGTSALMMAAPDFEKVDLLIRHGASVNAKSKTRYTAIMIAASHHATDSVRLLLDHKAEVQSAKSQPALFGANPLFSAAWSGDTVAMDVLHQGSGQINSKVIVGGMDEMTPLSVAAWQGDAAMVAALIRDGASVDNDSGVTALDIAVFKNDTKVAAVLIAQKANVNHVDKLGYTPLHWAANIDFGDTQMLELLLRANADPQLRNKEGLTPLQIAIKYQHSRHQEVLKNIGR